MGCLGKREEAQTSAEAQHFATHRYRRKACGIQTPMVEVLGLGSTAVCTIASREMFDSRLEYLDAGELDI